MNKPEGMFTSGKITGLTTKKRIVYLAIGLLVIICVSAIGYMIYTENKKQATPKKPIRPELLQDFKSQTTGTQ